MRLNNDYPARFLVTYVSGRRASYERFWDFQTSLEANLKVKSFTIFDISTGRFVSTFSR